MATSPSDLSGDLEPYKLYIVLCDLSVVTSKKNPQDAIKSLFFNAYSLLVHILGTCFSTIKEVALDAVWMKQVVASTEKVLEVADLRSLFESLALDKNWDDLHFLDVAISCLPRPTTAAARMVLGHYKRLELNFNLQSKYFLASLYIGKLQCIVVLIECTQSCMCSVGVSLTFDLS